MVENGKNVMQSDYAYDYDYKMHASNEDDNENH